MSSSVVVSVMGTNSFWSLVGHTGFFGKIILLVLLGASVLSWAVMAYKFKFFRIVHKKNITFRKAFKKCGSLMDVRELAGKYNPSTLTGVFSVGYDELLKQSRRITRTKEQSPLPFKESLAFDLPSFERALSRGKKMQLEYLRKNLVILASTGSVSPFIGLFGTVWGIINSFQQIGVQQSASLAVVAPGISEALVATAVGLFAAIPAVVGYNYFNEKIRSYSTDIDDFCLELVNILTRVMKDSSQGNIEE